MSFTIKDNTDEFLSALEKAIENGLTKKCLNFKYHYSLED